MEIISLLTPDTKLVHARENAPIIRHIVRTFIADCLSDDETVVVILLQKLTILGSFDMSLLMPVV